MNAPAENPTRARLEEIRERLARCAADRWSHEFNEDGEAIIVTRAVPDPRSGKKIGDEAPEALLRFSEGATWAEKELVREAREDLAFVLDQLTVAGRMIRSLRERLEKLAPGTGVSGRAAAETRAANLAAEASIKCAEPAFQTFLRQHHASDDDGDLGDTDNAAAVLRRALKIESRKQLNTESAAAERWRALRADYLAWVRGADL